MISVTDALSFIEKNRPLTDVQVVSLEAALGRTLANNVEAKLTHPPLNASAMDGYAVKLADISERGARLTVIGEAPAGTPFSKGINSGEAVRIFTGGAVPSGADTVIIQENITAEGNQITVEAPQGAPRHIRLAGLDFQIGETLIKKGALIGPSEIAVAAASGQMTLQLRQKLRVAILTGGNELVSPGETPKAGQIINSNPYALASMIKSWGHDPVILPTAKDTVESIADKIKQADDADVIVPIGGASVGDHDHMRAAFREAGLEMIFEKVAVRPGKPTWFGKLGGRPILGLPGNPASAFVCAQLFLRPLLSGEPSKYLTAKLSIKIAANGPRESYQRAILTPKPDGTLYAAPLPLQDSGLMTPFLIANGLLKLTSNQSAKKAGEIVEVMLIKPLF